MKKRLPALLKVAITIIGLIFAFSQIDFRQAWRQIQTMSGGDIGLILGLMLISLAVRAYRWGLLLQGAGAQIGFRRLLLLYYAGNFFNAFLPSGFGGDAIRALEAAREMPASVAVAIVLVDRMTGLMILFAIALLALPFRPVGFPNWLALTVGGMSVAGLLGGGAVLHGGLLRWLDQRLPPFLAPLHYKPIAQLTAAIESCGWAAIGKAFVVSIIFNGILISWWYVAGNALGYQIPLSHYILVIPILSASLLLPSIGGLGVRESLAPSLFAAAGLSSTEAVTLTLLLFTLLRLSSLVGAPLYLGLIWQNRRQIA